MCRVLIVDDNADAADTLAALLVLSGHETSVAYEGASALEHAERMRPHVVVLDLGMPGMSGYEVARHLRRCPWGSALKLIALTGWGQARDRRMTREAGFDEHLVKPADPDELIHVVERLAGSA